MNHYTTRPWQPQAGLPRLDAVLSGGPSDRWPSSQPMSSSTEVVISLLQEYGDIRLCCHGITATDVHPPQTASLAEHTPEVRARAHGIVSTLELSEPPPADEPLHPLTQAVVQQAVTELGPTNPEV